MADSGADSISHLNLAFTTKEFNMFVDNLLAGKSATDPSSAQEKPGAKAESSSTTNLMSAYLNLPHHLKSCLDYCYFVLYNSFARGQNKDRLACLLLAEGLIKQDSSSILKEDAASSVIDELISLGMLEKCYQVFDWVSIPSKHQKLCIRNAHRKNLFAKAPDSAIRLYIVDGGKDNLFPNLNGLTITSLFDLPASGLKHDKCISQAYMKTICKLKSLVVLDLEGYIECLPDEIGDLVNLKYLHLRYRKFNDVPHSEIKFIQGFDMMFCHMDEVPVEVSDIQRLWNLMINRNTFKSKVRVSTKIELRLNLHTISNVHARGGIMSELSKFTQLRILHIICVSDEHATELSATIMNMTNLLSLSMEAERKSFGKGERKESVALLPELEEFSPPSRLREVNLTGRLVGIPTWLFSMESLSSLTLSHSYLYNDSIFELQFLPNLKNLYLSNASKDKQIGEEFCQAGGFPKLEMLRLHSSYLVEWSEIANGAFLSLRSLTFQSCTNLMLLPNGLQNITMLDQLNVYPIHGDLERRLKGIENYKIKNIPKVYFRSR